ncbi:M15 family metallopeptidase [Leucobacter sp.]
MAAPQLRFRPRTIGAAGALVAILALGLLTAPAQAEELPRDPVPEQSPPDQGTGATDPADESGDPSVDDSDPGREPQDPDPAPSDPAADPGDGTTADAPGTAAPGAAAPAPLTAPAAIPSRFVDMKPGQRFYREIEWMRTSGLSTGVRTPSGQAYLPKHNLSREAMAAFLYRRADPQGYTPPKTSPFVDVPTTHKFYREISWMRKTGLSTGISTPRGREYRPSERLSREAMAAFLYRSAKPKSFTPPKSSPFLDLPTNHKFYREITWMATGLTTGTCTPRGREYFPGGKLTREAMAAFMYRSAKKLKVELNACVRPDLNSPASITVVVNKKRPLSPIRWAPGDLVMPAGIPNTNGQPVRRKTAQALQSMNAAMRAEIGRGFIITSGFRSYEYQAQLFNNYVARDGLAAAESYSARPGHSEHQTGLAVDLDDGLGCGFQGCFGVSAAGQWLRHNAYRFGFILRYDSGQQHIVGYIYEPWHFRYVGTAVARDMHDRGYVNLETYFQLPAAPRY